jgi:hypothetical protein
MYVYTQLILDENLFLFLFPFSSPPPLAPIDDMEDEHITVVIELTHANQSSFRGDDRNPRRELRHAIP